MQLALALGAGAASALAYATVLSGNLGAVMLAYLAQLPLFLVGLWLGTTHAVVAAVSATAVATALSSSVTFGVLFAAVNAAPAAFLTRQALLGRPGARGGTEWYPPGLLVAWVIGLAAGAFLLAVVSFLGSPGGLAAWATDVLATTLSQLESGDGTRSAEVAAAIGRFFPGAVGASWVTMMIVNGVLAFAILEHSGRGLRPAPKMSDIELPGWMLPATAIAAVGTALGGTAGFVGANLILILCLAYVLMGLGVIHAVARNWVWRRPGLAGIYVAIFLFGWPVVILAFVGLIEPWAQLKQRFAGPPAGGPAS